MKLNPIHLLLALCVLTLTLPTTSLAKSTTSNTSLSSKLEPQPKSKIPRGWAAFSSNEFSVTYPSGRDWVYSIKFDPVEPLSTVFGPENKLNGQDVWTITSYSTNVDSWKSVMEKVSQVQKGEVATTKKVKLSGTSGTMVTVTSKNSAKKKRIFVVVNGESVGRSDVIYVLSNGGLSEKGFETFYKSFYIVPLSKVSNPVPTKYLKPARDGGLATFKVEHVTGTSFLLSGTLRPANSCQFGDVFEFILDQGNGNKNTFTIDNCREKTFSEKVNYAFSAATISPVLLTRYVDPVSNVWENNELYRYGIQLDTSASPTVRLLSNTKG